MKRALILGITGQTGSYLAELLLEKEYEVHGIIRRSSSFNTGRIDHIFDKLNLHYGDITDHSSTMRTIANVVPHEIYNLAAQSHVKVSFDLPVYSNEVDYMGALNILESIKGTPIKYYQASSSELFGDSPPPQNEGTPMRPRSPYAVAKLAAYWAVKNYREAYGTFACNGILFNHESPRRGETFVTRKITQGLAKILAGKQDKIVLGNINAKRDWGFAGDYAVAIYKMMQKDAPREFVIGTGKSYSVRQFVEECFKYAGMPIRWEGFGIEEKGITYKNKVVVEISPKYFRPTEVESLQADPSRAMLALDWSPQVSFKELVRMMVNSDLNKEGLSSIG